MEKISMVEKIKRYWDAFFPILYLNTFEESKGLQLIFATDSDWIEKKEVLVWTEGDGLNLYRDGKLENEKGTIGYKLKSCTVDLSLAEVLKGPLMQMLEQGDLGGSVIVFTDIHNYMEDTEAVALLKKFVKRVDEEDFRMVFLSSVVKIPKELEKFVTIIEMEYLTEDEIREKILNKKGEASVAPDFINTLTVTLKGLTSYEIDSLLSLAASLPVMKRWTNEALDLVQEQKKQLIMKSGILEMVTVKETIDDIGGLENLKKWLEDKAVVIKNLEEARKFGVDAPKGVLIAGVPGCGKSLSAKAASKLFNVPLLRMDMGRLMGKYVGESESNMRKAIALSEAMAPCVLWIDELEKAFAGIGGKDDKGGSEVTTRLFGNFLTWMQEKERPVFVVATANHIEKLPPELLRKGRFDEIFYVKLPNPKEREMIFNIHIKKRRPRDITNINVSQLVKETDGYSGADIEGIVKEAVEKVFVKKLLNPNSASDNILTTEDIMAIRRGTSSLKEIMKDALNEMDEFVANNRMKSASIE